MLRYELRRMKVGMKVILVLAAVFFANSKLADATTINQVSANINLTAQSANFEIVYNGVPDFFTVDSAGRPQDQFRVYIASPNNSLPGLTWEGKFLNGDPWLTQTLGTINVTHGSSPPFATLSFSQNSDIVDFSLPLSLLNLPTGFSYLLVSFFWCRKSGCLLRSKRRKLRSASRSVCNCPAPRNSPALRYRPLHVGSARLAQEEDRKLIGLGT